MPRCGHTRIKSPNPPENMTYMPTQKIGILNMVLSELLALCFPPLTHQHESLLHWTGWMYFLCLCGVFFLFLLESHAGCSGNCKVILHYWNLFLWYRQQHVWLPVLLRFFLAKGLLSQVVLSLSVQPQHIPIAVIPFCFASVTTLTHKHFH